MKQITKEQLTQLADDYAMSVDIDGENPSIYNFHKGKPYGFEATENDGDNLYGFRFFGEARFQSDLLDVWNELTEEESSEKLLTPELAKSLFGKKVMTAYRTAMGYEVEMLIIPEKVETRNEKSIGQSTTDWLYFEIFENDTWTKNDFMYEWQGIFRVGGSAHNVYIKNIQE